VCFLAPEGPQWCERLSSHFAQRRAGRPVTARGGSLDLQLMHLPFALPPFVDFSAALCALLRQDVLHQVMTSQTA
jgi:hypothetical protein